MKTSLALVLILVMLFAVGSAHADQLVYEDGMPKGSVIGDAVAGSPELAPRGDYAIGVRTIELVHKDVVDLKSITEENPRPLYDRPLTVEVWYPAVVARGQKQASTYRDYIGEVDEDYMEAFDYAGRAIRDAEAFAEDGPYPVLIITHGYPGSRYLLSNLGENLSTKGYVVFSIAHTDNTYIDFDPSISLMSAVINRTQDQRFMVSALEDLNAEGFLAGILDTENVGMIGYSFGGFGLLRTLGVKFNDWAFSAFSAYADLMTEEEGYEGDKRIKAAALFAPYGADWFDPASLANISVPTFWLQGTVDTTVPFAGVHGMWEQAVNTESWFLTYELMHHKVAPNPSPIESQKYDFADGARRWDDWVWNQWHVNGINFHFLTAFFDAQLKGEAGKLDYLTVKEENGTNCVYTYNSDGTPAENNTVWPGFHKSNTTVGLKLEHHGIE